MRYAAEQKLPLDKLYRYCYNIYAVKETNTQAGEIEMTEITKNHNYKGTNYHEVMVKSNRSNNTGPVRVFAENHKVKFGMLDKWIESNPNIEIVKVFHHEFKV